MSVNCDAVKGSGTSVSLLFLEWAGALTALIATGLIASATLESLLIPFLFYFVSNLCWIAFALRSKLNGVLVMNIAFLITSIIGILNHW